MRKLERVVVIGLGKLGRALAETLAEEGVDVLAVDKEMEIVQDLCERLPAVVQADGTSMEALDAVGVRGASVAVIAIGGDFQAAILATSILRELGVGRVIARANSEREARILRLVGAEEILFIEHEMGRRVALNLVGK